MAATEARVVITAQDQTAAAFRTATAKLDNLRKQSSAALGGIRSAMAAVGGGVMLQAAREAIQLGDEIQRASVKAGIGAGAMSELAYAAKMSDVEIGSLSNAIRFMQRSIVDATGGNKAAQDSFARLGVNLAALKNLAADRQFEAMADAIAGIEDPAARATAVTEIFGRAGADLLPLFEQGAKGIRMAREESVAMAAAMDEATVGALARTDEQLKKFNARYDAAVGRAVVAGSEVANKFFDGYEKIWRSRAGFLLRAGELLPGIGQLTKYLPAGEVLFGEKNPMARGTIERGQSVVDPKIAEAQKAREASLKRQKELYDSLQEVDVTAKSRGPSMQEWLRSTESAIEQEVRLWRDRSNDLEAQRAMGVLSEQQYNLRRQELNRQYNDELLGETQVTASKMAATWKESTDSMSVFAEQASRNMQDAFADFLFDPFQGGLRGMLQSFLAVIRRMVAEAMAAQIFGKPGSGGLGDAISGFFSNLFGGPVAGKAIGGPVMAGQPYMVGERGPEMFVPYTGGRIVPNNAIGGGVTVAPVYNVDARGASTDLVKALPAILEANTRRAVEMARAAIYDDYSRGAFGRA